MIEKLTYSAWAAVSIFVQTAFGPPQTADEKKSDRGDVPGWVMITVMTAIVVIALLAVFREQVLNAVTNAFKKVNDSGNTK